MSLDPFTAGFDLVKTGLDKFFPDADTELKGKLEAAAASINNDYQLQLTQIETNKVEASSNSVFVAGARPAAMWVGVISLLYSGIGISLLSWLALIWGLPPVPVFSDATAENILFGLLGLGGMRTVEKLKSVQTNKIG